MAQPLIKFFRVAALPDTGVQGALYFVTGEGILYVYNGSAFEAYSGLKTAVVEDKVLKVTKHDGSLVEYKAGEIAQSLINDLDYDDAEVEGQYVSSVKQVDGKIEITRKALPTESADVDSIGGAQGVITLLNGQTAEGSVNLTMADNQLQAHLVGEFDTKGTATGLIDALDYTDEAVEGQYIASVSQADGKISVTRATLPQESADVDSIDDVQGAITLKKGNTATGSINLKMVGQEMQAELVGSFADGAQVNVIEGVKVNGTALTIDGNKAVDWKLVYNSEAKKLQVLDSNKSDAVINEVDATAFIKDGMVNEAKIVWCTVNEEGAHVVVPAGTEGAVRCLQITFNTDAGKDDIHIPLNELTDVYTGAEGEITVSEANVIGLADKSVKETRGEALTPAHGGVFDVITDVNYDTKGRISEVVTTQVTLPTVADGTQTGSDDYVSVSVSTIAGAVSAVTVNTDTLTTKLTDIQKEIDDNEHVTSAALNELNGRMVTVEGEIDALQETVDGLDLGVKTVKGQGGEYVTVTPTEASKGDVTVSVSVATTKATNTAYANDALATDGYVEEQAAAAESNAKAYADNLMSWVEF